MRDLRIRRSVGLESIITGVIGFGALADVVSAQAADETVRVRVVERGTRKPVANALVERYVSEITISDSWRYRIVGDDLLPRKDAGESKKRREPDVPGTASTWIAEGGTGRATTDASGVAVLEGSFEGGATLVASTPTSRGACVVFAKEGDAAPASAEIEVGPPRAVDVIVVGIDGKPRAGIPVEFGRFLDGARPREADDGGGRDECELWDRLGKRVLTDEQGRGTLAGLELHGADDLDVLRGAKASPFCARVLVLGPSRVVAAIDPDAPPNHAVRLVLPAVGSIALRVEFPDHLRIDVDGDVHVMADSAALAPGFQRLFDVVHGRARLFPVEAGLAGKLRVGSKVLDDGSLTATTVQIGALSEPVFGDDFLPEIESSCALPRADGEHVDAALALPDTWFQVCMRLLDSARRPVPSVEVDATLIADVTGVTSASKKPSTSSHERRCPTAKSAADGRVAIVMRRPLVPATLRVALTARAHGSNGGRAERPLVFGDDRWRIDLGDVVLDR